MIDCKKISRTIRIVYAALLAAVVTLVVLCEYQVYPIEGMMLSFDPSAMYILEVGMLFAVGLGILAALKGFNWCLLHKVYALEGVQRAALYQALSNARNCLLSALMVLGVVFYYGTLQNWGMYYALAAFVASLFCLPSAEGVEIELKVKDESLN
jgi:predicted cobalt transporter CbtA